MNSSTVEDQVKAARVARYKRVVSDLDYRRSVVRLNRSGMTQARIAVEVGIAQPTVNKILARAKGLPMPVDGFSGADPFEICERYAAGELTRSQLVDELVRWRYRPRAKTTDLLDDLLVDGPGSVDDLSIARRRGLIDAEIYDEIVAGLNHRSRQPTA